MRRTLPLIITLVAGVLLVAVEFIPHPFVAGPAKAFQDWGKVVMSAMIILGIINIYQINVPKIREREEDWPYKLLMLVTLVVTTVIGFAWGPFDAPGTAAYALFDSIYRPLTSTMFALLAWFVSSAAFRAFRARSVESTLLLVAAAIVMLGRVPVGTWLWDGLPGIVDWLMEVPNLAAKRAILIGAALGAISTSVRVILGLERSHLS